MKECVSISMQGSIWNLRTFNVNNKLAAMIEITIYPTAIFVAYTYSNNANPESEASGQCLYLSRNIIYFANKTTRSIIYVTTDMVEKSNDYK